MYNENLPKSLTETVLLPNRRFSNFAYFFCSLQRVVFLQNLLICAPEGGKRYIKFLEDKGNANS